MTKLHSILTKVIPMCTFGMAFTNSNFKIQILLFLDSAHLGLLKIQGESKKRPQFMLNISGYKHARKLRHNSLDK